MSKLLLFYVFLIVSSSNLYAQECIGCQAGQSRGGGDNNGARTIGGGIGQEFKGSFLSVQSMYFVQFAVYPSSVSCQNIKAPQGLGMIWLITIQLHGLRDMLIQALFMWLKLSKVSIRCSSM
ncbi:MAG: hypothetical protein AAFR87_22550 [Bacteroidota bacterium]